MRKHLGDSVARLPGYRFPDTVLALVDRLADEGKDAPTIEKQLLAGGHDSPSARTIRNRINARGQPDARRDIGENEEGDADHSSVDAIAPPLSGDDDVSPPPGQHQGEKTETVAVDAGMESGIAFLRVTNLGQADTFQILVRILDPEVIEAPP